MAKKNPVVYAFIDSQNLNLGTNKDIYHGKKRVYQGWQLDFAKFRRYLSDKFRASKAFLFIDYIKDNQPLYTYLQSCGYDLVFKPTTKDGEGKPKGNVDAELVLHASAIEFHNYNKAIIVSGDGDFRCLHEYLLSQGKLGNIIIPNRLSESSLLREYQQYKIFLMRDKEKLENIKSGRRSALSRR